MTGLAFLLHSKHISGGLELKGQFVETQQHDGLLALLFMGSVRLTGCQEMKVRSSEIPQNTCMVLWADSYPYLLSPTPLGLRFCGHTY